MRALYGRPLLALQWLVVLVACATAAGSGADPVSVMGAAAPPTGVNGDGDCSGAVDVTDVRLALEVSAGVRDAACPQLADADCSGDVAVSDALRDLFFVASLTSESIARCPPVGDVYAQSNPSSHELVENALDGGEIDSETAILYEFYAAFGDERLPEEYQGDDTYVSENPALKKLPTMWDTLSQTTQDLLLPFLRTPAESDSWYATGAPLFAAGADIEWGTVSASHPVKVWWDTRFPTNEARAQQIAAAIDANIWNAVTTPMQKVPLPDCGAACPSGGGDEKLDIYIVDAVSRAYTSWNPPDEPTCENTAAFIVINAADSLSDIAHELTHAVQFAFPYANGDGCAEYDWWAEATATAVEDLAYQVNNEEHVVAPYYLDDTVHPLEYSPDDYRKYGAYLFPFYMARVKSSPAFIGDTFSEFETESDSVKAIDSVLKEYLYVHGFDDVWPDFALKNWNRKPVRTYQQDSLMRGALPIAQRLDLQELELDEANVEHLASVYYKFTFANEVRHITFTNTLRDLDHASVWAIRKVGGEWQDPEDWTDAGEKKFCRDVAEQNLTELIIILGNSDGVGKNALSPSENPKIEGKDFCPKEYVGTATFTITQSFGDGQRTITGSVSVNWVPRPDDDSCFGGCFQTSGEGQWTFEEEYSVDDGTCHSSGSGSQEIIGTMTVFPPGAIVEKASFTGTGSYVGQVTVSTECPHDSFEQPAVLPLWFASCRLDQCSGGAALLNDDGSVAESGSQTTPQESIQYSYRFDPTFVTDQ